MGDWFYVYLRLGSLGLVVIPGIGLMSPVRFPWYSRLGLVGWGWSPGNWANVAGWFFLVLPLGSLGLVVVSRAWGQWRALGLAGSPSGLAWVGSRPVNAAHAATRRCGVLLRGSPMFVPLCVGLGS